MPVTHVVNMHDAKTKLSHLVAQAREGDDIIIARAGKPVAKLIPFDGPAHPQRFGALAGLIPDLSEEEWAETDAAIARLWDL